MAKIQISFQDNSDNEDEFIIRKGTTTPIQASDTQIANLSWDGTAWAFTGTASNGELTQGINVDPSQSGQQYVFLYDETVADTYYYGVSAKNGVGESGISTSGAVTVTA